jgi:methylmalonyl-CoA/ethylmalonyl-CoA epimerase
MVERESEEPPADEPLALHHIGVVVADIAVAATQYATKFNYRVRSEIFHDPVQTAYVQFLQLPGDTVFLELVAPDGERSKVANALKKGGGLNHLCYATPDIDKSWASLRARGLFPLQRPVPAVAFGGRRIAWFMHDKVPFELVEMGPAGQV